MAAAITRLQGRSGRAHATHHGRRLTKAANLGVVPPFPRAAPSTSFFADRKTPWMVDIRSLCVYCGSSNRGPKTHKQAARKLGRLMAERRIRLVYGGGRVGVMGTLADAVLDAGGEVVGIIPRFLDEYEVGHRDVTQFEVVESMHERKARMAQLSDGFVVLPGGLGTLDETFEIVTWKQLHLHDRPIVVVDLGGYWKPLQSLVDSIVKSGYARPENAALLRYVDKIEDVLPALAEMPQGMAEVDAKWM